MHNDTKCGLAGYDVVTETGVGAIGLGLCLSERSIRTPVPPGISDKETKTNSDCALKMAHDRRWALCSFWLLMETREFC